MTNPDFEDSSASREMNTPSSHLEKEPVNRLFWKYSIPAVLAMLVNGAYALIDGLFIGRIVGTEGLAAVNFVWPVVGLITGLGIMVGIGAGTEMSIERGKHNWKHASEVVANATMLVFFIGLLVPLPLLFFQCEILELLGVTTSTMHHAQSYTYYLGINAIALLAGAAFPLILRNDDRPHLTTIVMTTGALLNILLDWLFVVVMDYEVAGAAVATVISQAVIGLWAFLYFFSYGARQKIPFSYLVRIDKRIITKITKTGLPSFFIFFYYAFLVAVHNLAFHRYGGVTAVAAFAIVAHVQNAYYLFAEGISTGIQPLISFNAGARNYFRIKKTLKLGLKTILAFGVFSLLVINLFPTEIAGLFNARDTVLVKITATGLHLHLSTLFLDGAIVLAGAFFQAIAKTRAALFISVSNLLIVLPILAILPEYLGIYGVWLALPVSNVVLASVTGWMLYAEIAKYPGSS